MAKQAVTEKKLLRIGEAAEMLGVSKVTLRRWDKKGILKPVRVGGRTHPKYPNFTGDRRYRTANIEKLINDFRLQ